MDTTDLIDNANDIDDYTKNKPLQDETYKELKKIEMYVRKTYIMLKHYDAFTTEHCNEEAFMKGVNDALIRDQRYVKARDSLEAYSI